MKPKWEDNSTTGAHFIIPPLRGGGTHRIGLHGMDSTKGHQQRHQSPATLAAAGDTLGSDTSCTIASGNVSVGGGDGHPKQLRQPQHRRGATMKQQHPQSAVPRHGSAASGLILVPPGLPKYLYTIFYVPLHRTGPIPQVCTHFTCTSHSTCLIECTSCYHRGGRVQPRSAPSQLNHVRGDATNRSQPPPN